MNLPTSPIHDLVVKDDDLVVATHGRSFWVLDDLTPLRQVNEQIAQADMNLYQPQTAVRLHYPEEIDTHQAAGTNPPPGAIIDYYFKDARKAKSRSKFSMHRASRSATSQARKRTGTSNRPNGRTRWKRRKRSRQRKA